MVKPEDVNIIKCVCLNDTFDSLGTMEGLKQRKDRLR